MVADPIRARDSLPRGPMVERDGQLTRAFRNYFEYGGQQIGEVVSGITQLDDAIQVNQGQISGINGQLGAYYALSVDVSGNGAFLKLSDDTSFGSAITISADEITLNADAINFGAQTVFDLTSETFISTTGTIKARYGSAFGASSDVVLWHGPVGISNGSETSANGYLVLAEDGLYINGSAAGWGATASEAAASNDRAGFGGNRLYHTDFNKLSGYWSAGGNGTQTTYTAYTQESVRILRQTRTGLTAGQRINIATTAQRTLFPVKPGQFVAGACDVYATFASSARLEIIFRDSAGSTVTDGLVQLEQRTSSLYTSPSSMANRYSGIALVPASAETAELRADVTSDGTGDTTVWIARPQMYLAKSASAAIAEYELGFQADPNSDVTSDNQAADVAPGAVTNSEGASTDGSITLTAHTWVTVQSKAITATGGDILVAYNAVPYVTTTTTINPIVQARILRGGTTIRNIHTTHFPSTNSDGSQQVGGAYSGFLIDSPSAGTYTYYLQLKGTTASGSGTLFSSTAEFRSLYLTEFKR